MKSTVYSACRVVCLFILLCSSHGLAQDVVDMLRYFDPSGGLMYYHYPALEAQAAHLKLPEQGCIRALTLHCSGNAGGAATLHIYGHEGGLPAPIMAEEVVSPIRITKSKSGIETITIRFEKSICMEKRHFFVVLDSASGGMVLLSDATPQEPFCRSEEGGDYYFQYVRSAGKQWQHGKYRYAIEVEAEFPAERKEPVFYKDTTILVQESETQAADVHAFSGISCGDVNNDGYIDIIANGRLFLNNQGSLQERVDVFGSAAVSCQGHVFIDVNNDGAIDALFIEGAEKEEDKKVASSSRGIVFLNRGDGTFTRTSISLPNFSAITSMSIADVNGDGFADIFIGQCMQSSSDDVQSYLLLNTGQGSFRSDTSFISRHATCKGSSFVDVDNDGNLDLFIGNYYNQPNQIYWGTPEGLSRTPVAVSTTGSYTLGGHWGDSDNNGRMELISSLYHHPVKTLVQQRYSTLQQHLSSGSTALESRPLGSFYEEKRSGGVWGDVNNDGLLDCVFLSSCNCRYAELYIQEEKGIFVQQTEEYGLSAVEGGRDAVWVDINNDGALDIAVIEHGALSVYKQRYPTGSNYIALDVQSRTGQKDAIGARVQVYAGNDMYTREVASGRGLLMQDPLRLHIGIHTHEKVDSAVVRWPDGEKETFRNIEPNGIQKLLKGKGVEQQQTRSLHAIDVFPNPFREQTAFQYELLQADHVTIEVYTLSGVKLITVVDEYQRPGIHTIRWDGKTENDGLLSTGAYMYRYVVGNQEVLGRVYIAR